MSDAELDAISARAEAGGIHNPEAKNKPCQSTLSRMPANGHVFVNSAPCASNQIGRLLGS